MYDIPKNYFLTKKFWQDNIHKYIFFSLFHQNPNTVNQSVHSINYSQKSALIWYLHKNALIKNKIIIVPTYLKKYFGNRKSILRKFI